MSEKKYCLQCGAELFFYAVPADPAYPQGPQVPACSACHSRAYDIPGNKILELTAQRDELLAALKEITAWYWPNVSGRARDEMPKYKELVKKYDHA